ncbi:MAG: histidinol-phosphate transaminase [bacterium]
MLPKPRDEILNFNVYKHGKTIRELTGEIGESEIIKLGSNENMLGISPKAIEAIKRCADGSNYYPEPASTPLVRKIAERYGFTNEMIIVGAGTTELIEIIALAYFSPSDEIEMPYPSFIMYPISTALIGATLKKIPLTNFTIDVNAIISSITPNTKAVFIANPNNPTGTIIGKKDMAMLIEKIPESVLIVIDEAYADLVESDDYPDSLAVVLERRNVIVLRSFSKSYGLAGLRVGFGIGSEEVIKNLYKVKKPFNVSTVAQEAAMAALDDRDFLMKTRKCICDGKKYLYGELEKLKVRYIPTETNFILTLFENDDIAKDCCKFLQNRGIITRPMSDWGVLGGLRITIGLDWQNKKFIEALGSYLKVT